MIFLKMKEFIKIVQKNGDVKKAGNRAIDIFGAIINITQVISTPTSNIDFKNLIIILN